MKILHVPFCYYPDAVGGTEVYVEALAHFQKGQGIEALIAAPGAENGAYVHDGQTVFRFKTSSMLDLRDLYGNGDVEAATSFSEILKRTRPDAVHLHAFTSGVSIRLVRSAHQQEIPVVFTYHTPTVTCCRGTLLVWGKDLCEGRLDARQCARCTLHGHGLSKAASWLVGGLSPEVGNCLAGMGLSGGVWTAIRTSELVALRHSAVRMLFSEVDHVVAVCEWVKALLTSNGVDAQKITLSRQGLSRPVERAAAERQGFRPPLRIAFLGRIDAVKGLGILIEALQRAPKLPVVLDIFAVVQGQAGERLKLQLSEQVKCDPRIRFRAPLAAAQVVERLREYDALAVPSQWMETGPLVVYEAFAAGIPVIGSRLGGIAELVRDEENGLLVEASSPEAWAAALSRLVDDPNLLPKLKSGIKPVRTMLDVAKEMGPVYESVLTKKKTLVGSTREGWTQ